MTTRRVLTVLVPRPKTVAERHIDLGSGIVAELQRGWRDLSGQDRIEVYYEGNRYGSQNLRSYDDRVKHAAGRLAQRHPTAHGFFDSADFVAVGILTFTGDWREATLTIVNRPLVDQWAGSVNDAA